MITKNNIIHQLYSDAVVVFNEAGTFTAKDKDGKAITIDMDAVNTEFNKQNYKNKRVTDGSKTYDDLSNQLDMLYHDLVAGKLDATGTWAKHIKAVKDANPKP